MPDDIGRSSILVGRESQTGDDFHVPGQSRMGRKLTWQQLRATTALKAPRPVLSAECEVSRPEGAHVMPVNSAWSLSAVPPKAAAIVGRRRVAVKGPH